MKRKIAVYANGWSKGALLQAIEGIKRYDTGKEFDIFVFLSHASYSEHDGINQGELRVYNLGDVREYDGIIVFSTMLNSIETAAAICRKAREQKVPVVSIGMEFEGVPYIGLDNRVGMRQLVTHLVEDHGVKRVVFIGGTLDHVDSIARLEETRSVLEEHGLTLADGDIYYANWGYNESIQIVDQLMDSREGLPDAIVCANDYMALAAGSQLTNRGVRIPEQVTLTGFDHVEEGKVFYPALTSVTQDYEEVGYRCCKILLEGQEEKSEVPRIICPTRLALAESCGCMGNSFYEEKRKDFCRYSYLNSLKSDLLDQEERVLQLHVINASADYETLKHNMQAFYERNHMFEGPDFYIVLNSLYFQDVMSEAGDFWVREDAMKLEPVVALEHGKYADHGSVDRQHLVPGYRKIDHEHHIYYILPLHEDRYNYGYIVLKDNPPVLLSKTLYSYLERLQQSLRSLRVNLRLDTVNKKLTQIYDKDPMTGLFNRFGYEDKAFPLYEECKARQGTTMVMFVDINYMKRINDQHGHIHGDNAIRIVADSIRENLKDSWIAVRFGGDEFLIIAPDTDGESAEAAKQSILSYLEQKNEDGLRPYQISASCGYVLTDPASPQSLQDYIREADAIMYEIKRQVHAKDVK